MFSECGCSIHGLIVGSTQYQLLAQSLRINCNYRKILKTSQQIDMNTSKEIKTYQRLVFFGQIQGSLILEDDGQEIL